MKWNTTVSKPLFSISSTVLGASGFRTGYRSHSFIQTTIRLLLLPLVFIALRGATGLTVHPDTLAERHSIVKRFAEADQEFTSHDIAEVFHEKETDSFHRISRRDLKSVTDQGNAKQIRLQLSSGSKIHLKLKKRSLFAPDTQFFDHTEHGHVKRAIPPQDCYATGDVEVDGVSDGFAALALCDGLHGSATNNGVEYYIHPVQHADGEHQVHILSRRATSDIAGNVTIADGIVPFEEFITTRYKRATTVTSNTYKTATSFVIELAMFNDAEYYARLQKIAPGREDEYVLMTMAASNALFGNKEKVGYDASIKIKLYMNWVTNPAGYKFAQSIFTNLRNFCKYTRSRYQYDMHFLHTGVTKQQGRAIGVAYVGGVCGKHRCGNTYSTRLTRFSTVAHEIGHNLGFGHHGSAKCPEEIKSQGGGFMGGGASRNFSPCNKWEMYNFFSKGKGKCLFEETAAVKTSDKFVNMWKILPGQFKNPDAECRMVAGQDYVLYRPFDFRGSGECAGWMCINRNKQSPEFHKIKRRYAVVGYTCGDEMFCDRTKCTPWEKPGNGWDVNYLRENTRENHWSEWSTKWSSCSKPCGKGVQTKRRRCNFSDGPFLSPYCRGPSVQARLCNTEPCPGTSLSYDEIRKANGDEICIRFHNHNVSLDVQKDMTYLPKSQGIFVRDKAAKYIETKSCMIQCQRSPNRRNYIDSIMPDGTPCGDSRKSTYKRIKYNIELKCVDGVCVELSDCPDNQEKDQCGVCGGDPIHCIDKEIDQSDDVPQNERKVLATLPAGTKAIDINMKWWVNRGVRIEVYNAQEEKVIGKGGRFGKTSYRGNKALSFANTTWEYDHSGYIRSVGPTDQDLVVKVLRNANPIKRIYITYILPENDMMTLTDK